MRTPSSRFTGTYASRCANCDKASRNKSSASALTWRRHARIASASPSVSSSGDLSRIAMSIRTEARAAWASKDAAWCRHASRTMRLTSARSTERRAFRLPTVTPKRTLLSGGLLTAVAAHATLIDNNCRAARIDCSRGARRTAANSAGVLSRRAEAKPYRWLAAALLTSMAAIVRRLLRYS
jgi:hypothetical protein